MTECIQDSFPFAPAFRREVVARFDAGPVSSDGGALLLRERGVGRCPKAGGWKDSSINLPCRSDAPSPLAMRPAEQNQRRDQECRAHTARQSSRLLTGP